MMEVALVGANNPETGRVLNALQKAGQAPHVVGFIDNDPAKRDQQFLGYRILGGIDVVPSLVQSGVHFVNLITRDCLTRWQTSRDIAALGGRFSNLVHPGVSLDMVSLGVGNYIQEGVIVQAEVEIGHNSSIHMGSLVGHESKIGHSTFIAHGCNVSGCVSMGDGVFVGTGVTILPRLNIGRWAVLGAGAVVIRDVPPHSVVVGTPGRVIKQAEPHHASGDIFEGSPPS